MTRSISQIFKDHDGKLSDKWLLYLDEWDRLFRPYKSKEIHLLEIGIQNGGSLEIWAKYFHKAKKILGCDINPSCDHLEFKDHRILVIVGDINSDESQNQLRRHSESFDIIIDDGSHKSKDIIQTFIRYFPHLSENGIYVVEDMHTSYWKDYDGGLYNPFSAMAFFKRLTDIVNQEHWRNEKTRKNFLIEFEKHAGVEISEVELSKIHSIEFVNSLCILIKKPIENNLLGKRIIVGQEEYVTSGLKGINNSCLEDSTAIIEDDSRLDVFELISLYDSLNTNLLKHDQKISNSIDQKELEKIDIENLTSSDVSKNALENLKETLVKQEKKNQVLNEKFKEKTKEIRILEVQSKEQKEKINMLSEKVIEQRREIQRLKGEFDLKVNNIQFLVEKIKQQETDIQSQKEMLKKGEMDLRITEGKLHEQENEILSYALSNCWNYTRPFRKLKQKTIKGGKNG